MKSNSSNKKIIIIYQKKNVDVKYVLMIMNKMKKSKFYPAFTNFTANA